jgi:hypothetical protein
VDGCQTELAGDGWLRVGGHGDVRLVVSVSLFVADDYSSNPFKRLINNYFKR